MKKILIALMAFGIFNIDLVNASGIDDIENMIPKNSENTDARKHSKITYRTPAQQNMVPPIFESVAQSDPSIRKVKDQRNMFPPIYEPVRRGDLALVKELYQKYYVNDTHHIFKSITLAAGYGHVDILKFLAAQVDSNDLAEFMNSFAHRTPLLAAVEHGQLNMVKFLVENFNADISAKNLFGLTPFGVALMSGHTDIVLYLLKKSDARFIVIGNDGRVLFSGDKNTRDWQNYLHFILKQSSSDDDTDN